MEVLVYRSSLIICSTDNKRNRTHTHRLSHCTYLKLIIDHATVCNGCAYLFDFRQNVCHQLEVGRKLNKRFGLSFVLSSLSVQTMKEQCTHMLCRSNGCKLSAAQQFVWEGLFVEHRPDHTLPINTCLRWEGEQNHQTNWRWWSILPPLITCGTDSKGTVHTHAMS